MLILSLLRGLSGYRSLLSSLRSYDWLLGCNALLKPCNRVYNLAVRIAIRLS
jgi:hypothetical protein